MIVLDMDGVITSEEGYWKAAACTVVDLAARFGHPESWRAISGPDSDRLPSRLSVPHAVISTIKGLAINTNWDLCHLAACVLLRELAVASPANARRINDCHWDRDEPCPLDSWPAQVDASFARLLEAFLALDLPDRGFAMMEHLATGMGKALLRPELFLRQGPVWDWCFQHFQVWFAGSSWNPESTRAINIPQRAGIVEEESLILPAEFISTTLEMVRSLGWRLGIATGRTRRELIPTLERHRLLYLFEPDHIVTHTEIHEAEQALAAAGRPAQLSKPAPFPFLRALFPETSPERLAFDPPPPLPPGTIFVGDTVGDMAPARLLGARGIAVLTGPGGPAAEPALRAAGATGVIADLTGLPALLL